MQQATQVGQCASFKELAREKLDKIRMEASTGVAECSQPQKPKPLISLDGLTLAEKEGSLSNDG
jgi:hypothetical protein